MTLVYKKEFAFHDSIGHNRVRLCTCAGERDGVAQSDINHMPFGIQITPEDAIEFPLSHQGSTDDESVEEEPKFQRQISVGNVASPDQFPWLVAVHMPHVFCGGVLISSDAVLTAAHCVAGISEDDVLRGVVTIGTHDLRRNDCDECERRNVHSYVVHEKYNKGGRDDLAILFLSSPSSRPTAKLSTKPIAVNEIGVAVGWGLKSTSMQEALQDSSLPLYTSLRIGPKASCPYSYFEPDCSLCCLSYGDWGGETATACQGDSGGPLVRLENNELLGIASYVVDHGNQKCGTYARSVYMDIAYYYDWLRSHGIKNIPEMESTDMSNDADDAQAPQNSPDNHEHEIAGDGPEPPAPTPPPAKVDCGRPQCVYEGTYRIKSAYCDRKYMTAKPQCSKKGVYLRNLADDLESEWTLNATSGLFGSITSRRDCSNSVLASNQVLTMGTSPDYWQYEIVPESFDDCTTVNLVAKNRKSKRMLATSLTCDGFRWLKTNASPHTKFVLEAL